MPSGGRTFTSSPKPSSERSKTPPSTVSRKRVPPSKEGAFCRPGKLGHRASRCQFAPPSLDSQKRTKEAREASARIEMMDRENSFAESSLEAMWEAFEQLRWGQEAQTSKIHSFFFFFEEFKYGTCEVKHTGSVNMSEKKPRIL